MGAAHRIPAAVLEELYSFPLGPSHPCAALVQGADGALYGTTLDGGSNDAGTVFRVSTNGAFEVIASFNGDAGRPHAGLAPGPDGAFYGTTTYGGDQGKGTVFRVTTNGILTTLASLEFGAGPAGGYQEGITLGGDDAFYGTTPGGGSNDCGSVFRVTTDGRLQTLTSFTRTNGVWPVGRLTLGSDGALYGVTAYTFTQSNYTGGPGTIFRVTTNGILTKLVGCCNPTGLTIGSDGALYVTDNFYPNGMIFRLATDGAYTVLTWLDGTNGANPGSLVLGSDGALYGISSAGGANNQGTLFRVTTNGTLSTVRSFTAADGSPASLVFCNDGNFYGTTSYGGNGNGTVFRASVDGLLTNLVSFTDPNGAHPMSGLALGIDGVYYGTTAEGGCNGKGTVFRLTTNGTFTSLVSFDGTNGAKPCAGLILGSDGAFYGTTSCGGSSNYGTVFRLTTTGIVTTLASFDGTNGHDPRAPLVLGVDGALYGTTYSAGASSSGPTRTPPTSGGGPTRTARALSPAVSPAEAATSFGTAGTVFRLTADGMLSALVYFNGTNGANPTAGLMLGRDGALYGTTSGGGSNGCGTIFRVTTNGELTTLVHFNGTNGANPTAGLTMAYDGALYGTTAWGGVGGQGTAFRVTTNGSIITLVSFNGNTGAGPDGGLTFGGDGALYGMTCCLSQGRSGSVGFRFGYGKLFRLSTKGMLTTLVSFNGTNGGWPTAPLTLGSDGGLYGVTSSQGSASGGNIFRLSAWSFFSNPLQVNGTMVMRLTGQPGVTFTLETAEAISGSWQKRANVTAPVSDQGDGVGVIELREQATGSAPRFYRTVYPAY